MIKLSQSKKNKAKDKSTFPPTIFITTTLRTDEQKLKEKKSKLRIRSKLLATPFDPIKHARNIRTYLHIYIHKYIHKLKLNGLLVLSYVLSYTASMLRSVLGTKLLLHHKIVPVHTIFKFQHHHGINVSTSCSG